jgi:transposase
MGSISPIDARVNILIQQQEVLRQKSRILMSVSGIGLVLTATLLVSLPELGQRSGKEIAALVGVAPLNHDSGKFRGRRRIIGGEQPSGQHFILYYRQLDSTRSFAPSMSDCLLKANSRRVLKLLVPESYW